MGGDVGSTLNNWYHDVFKPSSGIEDQIKSAVPAQSNQGPTPVPTAQNSQDDLSAAAKEQQKARGAAATVFSKQGFGGAGGLLSSGGATSQRMLLGS